MTNFVYIATSIDGYIAKSDGDVEWLHATPNPENDDLGFEAFMQGVDALVMGRRTFEKVCSFGGDWPYSKPVFVLSEQLKEIPKRFKPHATLISGRPVDVVKNLNNNGFDKLYIDGGVTVQSFLKADLIDELFITRLPVVLGDGIPLFSPQKQEIDFEHVNTQVLLGQLVQSHYRRK